MNETDKAAKPVTGPRGEPTALLPKGEELWEADPKCEHAVYSASGGGIRCAKCRGWFCY